MSIARLRFRRTGELGEARLCLCGRGANSESSWVLRLVPLRLSLSVRRGAHTGNEVVGPWRTLEREQGRKGEPEHTTEAVSIL